MKYHDIVEGTFLERPNRFIAYAEINGRREKVHVKNTGRCRELLTEHAPVYLERNDSKTRSTAYDLVAVEKQGRLINMDSQAPNRAVEEWLRKKILFPDLSLLRPETKYGNSRFDFYIETPEKKIFMEVKGVTLEENNCVMFPDAPSERALKHVEELTEAKKDGYEAYILFVIQMKDVDYFTPNAAMQPAFAEALKKAEEAGVHILAYDCFIGRDCMEIQDKVKIRLSDEEDFLENSDENLNFTVGDIPKPLLKWYDTNRRILPWREEPAPYRVWVSEIMLQQTRVEAVKPYFERFIKALPDIKSLSEVEEDVLLKLWEGLRVISRLFMRPDDIAQEKVKKNLEEELRATMPRRAGDFNQAMMEIGAMVCIPNGAPHCEVCPLSHICAAYHAGRQGEFPVKSAKKGRTIEEKTVFILQDEEKTALHKRPDKGLLAGLYEFPNTAGHLSPEEVTAFFKKRGMPIVRVARLTDAVHVFSHKEWHMWGYLVRVDELSDRTQAVKKEQWIFERSEEVQKKYAIPSAFAAYASYIL